MQKMMMLLFAALFIGAPMAAEAARKSSKRAVKEDSSERNESRSQGGARNLITISPEIFMNSGATSGVAVGSGGVRMMLGYEFALKETNSILARIPIELSGSGSGPYSSATAAFGIGGGYRWYFTGGELSGLYANPLLMVQSSNMTDTYSGRVYNTSALLIKVAGEGGYQAQVWKNLFVGANFELSFLFGNYSVAVPGAAATTVSNIGLGSNATVGWAF